MNMQLVDYIKILNDQISPKKQIGEILIEQKKIIQKCDSLNDLMLAEEFWEYCLLILNEFQKQNTPLEEGINIVDVELKNLEIPEDIKNKIMQTLKTSEILDGLERTNPLIASSESAKRYQNGNGVIIKDPKRLIELGRSITLLKQEIRNRRETILIFENTKSNPFDKLRFDTNSGKIAFAGVDKKTSKGNKDYALLNMLYESKNYLFSVDDIINYANKFVSKSIHKFKAEGDIDDTIRSLRQKLKVSKDGIFPIRKERNDRGEIGWAWYEK